MNDQSKGALPCPFCGGEKVRPIEIDIYQWALLCCSCDARGPFAVCAQTALDTWNQRAENSHEIPAD